MRPLPMAITALAGTLTAGLLFTQTPMLSAVGNDDGKRDEDTPGVHLVDDEDDNDTGRDSGRDIGRDIGRDTGRETGQGGAEPTSATGDRSRVGLTGNSRTRQASRDDSSDRRGVAPAAGDVSSDRSSVDSRDRSADGSSD